MTSSYETISGTTPTPHGVHEARTVKRVVTPDERFDNDHDLMMMTEIGDGVFVQWSNCRQCTKRVHSCKCAGGPREPDYMKKWHENRFEKSLDERPDPSYSLLPSLVSWLEERGYTVRKNADDTEVDEIPPHDHEPLTPEEEEERLALLEDHAPDPAPDPEDDEAKVVDNGLSEALQRVREAKGAEDVGF